MPLFARLHSECTGSIRTVPIPALVEPVAFCDALLSAWLTLDDEGMFQRLFDWVEWGERIPDGAGGFLREMKRGYPFGYAFKQLGTRFPPIEPADDEDSAIPGIITFRREPVGENKPDTDGECLDWVYYGQERDTRWWVRDSYIRVIGRGSNGSAVPTGELQSQNGAIVVDSSHGGKVYRFGTFSRFDVELTTYLYSREEPDSYENLSLEREEKQLLAGHACYGKPDEEEEEEEETQEERLRRMNAELALLETSFLALFVGGALVGRLLGAVVTQRVMLERVAQQNVINVHAKRLAAALATRQAEQFQKQVQDAIAESQLVLQQATLAAQQTATAEQQAAWQAARDAANARLVEDTAKLIQYNKR